MYKICKVVMLATDKTDNKIGDICLFDYGFNIAGRADLGYPVQHLYILSDDEIKEGDYVYQTIIKKVIKAPFGIKAKDKYIGDDRYSKINATTDSYLLETTVNIGDYKRNPNYIKTKTSFPLIPQSFIKHFISEYNKGNKIEDVMVKYEYAKNNQAFYGCKCAEGFQGLCENSFNEDTLCKIAIKLKLNPDNTINIKTIKDSYSREEVIDIVKKLNCHFGASMSAQKLKKWIETNL